MRGIILIVIFYFLIGFSTIYAQCGLENTSYKAGEVVEYEIFYNWGFIWLNAGWVRLEVKDSKYNGKDTYLFDTYGSSHESYDWLFKVRDHYYAHVDKETLLPVYFHRKNYEGGFELENKYIFNWDDNIIYSETENSKKPHSLDTVKIKPCTFDVLSAVYYLRNIDFSSMKMNETRTISSILDNEVFELFIRYLGKETIEDREGKKHECIKFSSLLIEGSIFKGGEDMYVWVTDDENKVPILIEAKIVIGSAKAYLRHTEGLRN